MKIPFLSLQSVHNSVREEILDEFKAVFDSNNFILGDRLKRFESQYAHFNNTEFAIGVSNGLDALHLILLALEIGKGDEVIVPSNTFIASVLAISYTGATPVFVEPDIWTYNLDPGRIEESITKKTKAILPVHLYGQSCDMTSIMSLAAKYKLYVLEDNAQSQGGKWKNEKTGSIGHLNATSFYPGKNLGALGDAGAVTTNDRSRAEKIRSIRNYGSLKKYHNNFIGYNHRMDECQAAFLSVKLQYLNIWNDERRVLAKFYYESLHGIEEIILPHVHEDAVPVWHLFVIRTEKRDELQQYLKKEDIGTLIHYPVPPHLQPCFHYLGLKEGHYPIAEKIANTCLSLPLYPGLTKENVEYVSDKIRSFFEK